MNKVPFKKNVPIIANSPEEYEALVRYIKAKQDVKSWKFEFHIGKNGEVKPNITEYLK
jgi:hypothetical protein